MPLSNKPQPSSKWFYQVVNDSGGVRIRNLKTGDFLVADFSNFDSNGDSGAVTAGRAITVWRTLVDDGGVTQFIVARESLPAKAGLPGLFRTYNLARDAEGTGVKWIKLLEADGVPPEAQWRVADGLLPIGKEHET